jgi:ABC-2 type transport system permease protein
VSPLARAVRVELHKATTMRTCWVLGGSMGVYVATLAAFIAWSFTLGPAGATSTATPSLADPAVLRALYTSPASLGYVFPAVLGTLLITTEYRYQTLTSTFLAFSRRRLVLIAKLLVAVLVGLLVAVLALALTFPAVALVLAGSGHRTGLSDPDLGAAAGRTVIALALWATVGLGVGALVRNQVVAVVAVITCSQLVEPLLRLGMGAWGPTRSVARFLPGAASDGLCGASMYTIGASRALLAPWPSGLVLLAYALVLTGFGLVMTTRRDVV